MRILCRRRLWKHPERRPHTVAFGGFYTRFDVSVSKREFSARRYSSRGIGLSSYLFIFLLRSYDKISVFYFDVLLAVKLHFVVAPVGRTLRVAVIIACAELIAPFFGIETFTVEFVRPK